MRNFSASNFLILIAVWAFASGEASAHDGTSCTTNAALASLEALMPLRVDPKVATAADLAVHFRVLQRHHPNLEAPELDLKRLVNPTDWDARIAANENPTTAYGEKTAKSWMKALRFINRLADDNRPVDSHLLKTIHGLALEDLKFHGFEGRRIRADYETGKIGKDEFKKKLKKAYEADVEISGVDHNTLRGKFRSHPLDEIEHKGSSFLPDGTRYFSQKELEIVRKSQYMRLDEATVKAIAPGKYKATAHYGKVEDIEKNVAKILKETTARLEGSSNTEEILMNIIKMERDLIFVHPFLDGNGRSIRLLGDLLRRRHELPPSLYPNEEELVMTDQELLAAHMRGMRDYVTQWSERAYRVD